MVGKITLSGGQVATLGDDLKWTCEGDDLLADMLNLHFDPADETGVGVLFPPGYHAVQRAAAEMGAEAEMGEELPPLPEGEIS